MHQKEPSYVHTSSVVTLLFGCSNSTLALKAAGMTLHTVQTMQD